MKLISSLSSKEIKQNIASQLGKYLDGDGFIYKKGRNEYVNSIGEFVYIFNMLLTAWSDHYSLSIRLYITHKKVEKIYEFILGKSHKLTMGNSIERIYNSPDGKEIINGDMSILLITDEDIDAAVETLTRYYNDIAKPYYEKYKSLKEIDEIINNPPFDYCPADVGGNFDDRCIKGLIIGRLVNNLNYERLVSVYDEEIKQTMDNDSIDNYYKVKEYLSFNRIE